MSAPNRKEQVNVALSKLTEFLTVKSENSDTRRRQLLPYIWNELPDKQDWALMLKTERDPDFIPVDILWHKPTNEHCDCTTTSKKDSNGNVTIKAAWTNHGTNERMTDGRWRPIEVAEAVKFQFIKPLKDDEPHIPNPPDNPNPPAPDSQYTQILNRMSALESNLNQLANRVDEYNVILRNMNDASRIKQMKKEE